MTGISTVLLTSFGNRPDKRLLAGNSQCVRESWSAAEIVSAAKDVASGLMALEVPMGAHIGVVADNFDHWLIADLGSLHAGLVTVPRAGDTSTEDISFVLSHSGCTAVFVEDARLAERIGQDLGKNEALSTVIIMRGSKSGVEIPNKRVLDMEALFALGQKAEQAEPGFADSRHLKIENGDLATIVYTSGTTGNPKGVRLTHGNVLHNIETIPQTLEFSEQDRYLSFLPTWHSFERTLEYCLLDAGTTIHYSSKARLRRDMPKVKPTILAGVPRLWESLASSVMGKIEKMSPLRRRIVTVILGGSRRYADSRRRLLGFLVNDDNRVDVARGVGRLGAWIGSVFWAPCHLIADRMVYAKLREALGGSINFIVSGGGALQAHVDEFFNRAGVCLLNGYGLTETAPVISIRTPQANVLTTAGKRLPLTEWRVRNEDNTQSLSACEKGVLWVRGPQIMDGYHRNQKATDAVLQDGWFCTGDLAALTDQDDVLIQGRAKDTIVLRGGENIEPELIESPIQKIPYVQDVLVVGHGEKHLAALVIPDPSTLNSRFPDLDEDDIHAAARDSRVGELLHSVIAETLSSSKGFRIFERVPKIVCLDQLFSVEDGTLTLTMKKRRPQIENRHSEEIAELFREGSDAVQLAR